MLYMKNMVIPASASAVQSSPSHRQETGREGIHILYSVTSGDATGGDWELSE